MCIAACVLALSACKKNEEVNNGGDSGGGSGSSEQPSAQTDDLATFDVAWGDASDDTFVDASETVPTAETDAEYDDFVENSEFGTTIYINYNGSTATVTGEAEGVTVSAATGYVEVNSTVAGIEYVLSGTATDGAFKIYSDKKFKLTLNGVTINSNNGAAINIQSSKRIFVEAAEGTENVLNDATDYVNTPDGEDQKACLFAEGQLIFSGAGSLLVKGNYKHAICSDDYIYIHSGTNIAVSDAASDAMHTNGSITMAGGLVKLTAVGDCMDCDGGIEVRGGLLKALSTGTAGKGLKTAGDINITGGTVIAMTTGDSEYDEEDADISSSSALKCDGHMVINSASVYAKSTGRAGKGINVDSTLTITNGDVKVVTEGTQHVYSSEIDASPKAIKAEGVLTINSGKVLVRALGGEGSEGIESKDSLIVNGGTVGVYTYDDSFNASNNITINGGYVYGHATGNDGIDSNGTLVITGGVVVAAGTTAPEGGFDCDNEDGTTNNFTITGGTLLGIGGSTSTPSSTTSTQKSVIYSGSGSKDDLISIVAPDGTLLSAYTLPQDYSQLTVLFSSPALVSALTYNIYSGGSVSGGSTVYDFTAGGSYTAGTSLASFTPSSTVTQVGNGGGNTPGGGGETPGGGSTPGGGNVPF